MMDWNQLLSPLRPGEKHPRDVSPIRNAYEQDYDRIVFSYPFRRLQDKTQVFPLPIDDFVHTRLTHSLEVASVGRTLGRLAGKTIIARHPELKCHGINELDFGTIVSTASLAHDLGNPPFGHSGEDAISYFFLNHATGKAIQSMVNSKDWADLTRYEGNAQGFRILSHQLYQGLKISYSVLAAFTKYPRESLIRHPDKNRKSHGKYGFFQAEKEIFRNLAAETGLIRLDPEDLVWARHPLAFLVEAADDICYSIIDLEDGTNLGLVSIDEAKNLLVPIISDTFDPVKFASVTQKHEKIGLLRALAISELISQTVSVFLDNENKILSGEFDDSLTSSIPFSNAFDDILKLSVERIYRSKSVLEIETAGFEVISGLLDIFLAAAVDIKQNASSSNSKNRSVFYQFPDYLKKVLQAKSINTYELTLSILDYLTSMTDSFAMHTYRRLKGISMPGAGT